MKKNFLKTALALAVIAALPSLANAQWWSLTGSAPTAAQYFGTSGAQDIRIATAAGGGFNINEQRMIITNAGNVGIGQTGGGINPTVPFNKLLVENGDIYDPVSVQGDIYARLIALIPPTIVTVDPADFSMIAYSNRGITDGHNFAVTGYTSDPVAEANFGVTGIAADGKVNFGVTGAARNGADANVGINASVEVTPGIGLTNTDNRGVSVNVSAEDNADNTGADIDVEGNNANNNVGAYADVSGNDVANHNVGYGANVSGDNSAHNYGIDVDVTGNSATGFVTGAFYDVTGTSAGNVGVNTHVNGNATYSSGFLCFVGAGSNTTGINGANLNVDGAGGAANATGVYANVENGQTNTVGGQFKADGSSGLYTAGVEGVAVQGGTGLTVGVYGNVITGGSSANWAGFFNGNVFATAFTPSDAKLKENIREYKGALEILNKIDIKSYSFKSADFPGMNLPKGEQIGVLAANFKEVFPNLVEPAIYPGSRDGFKDVSFDAVNTNALVPVLVQAVKELDAKNVATDELKKEVEALVADKATVAKELEAVKADNESLKKDIADMKDMLDKICSNGCGDFKPASTLGGTTGSESNLFQNVPNPFSNTTVIPYTIGQGVRQAVLVVTDINGTEIKRFSTQQAGAGTFEINMGDLSTGTYIYSLFTDGKLIDTKKMMLAGK